MLNHQLHRNRHAIVTTLLAAALFLGFSPENTFGQSKGVQIVEQFPDALDQDESQIISSVEALKEAGALLSLDVLRSQISQPVSQPLALKKPSKELLTDAEVARIGQAGSLRIGWCYLCEFCDDWHLSLAGGYAISENGAIATCAHVLEPREMKEGSLIVVDGTGKVFPVTHVLAYDDQMDAAIAKIDHSLTPFALSTEVAPGDEAFCFSMPLDQKGYFSRGMVNRFYWNQGKRGGDDGSLKALRALRINVSTAWAPGSSGSPVLDAYGNVIAHVSEIETLSDAPEIYDDGEDSSSPATLGDVDDSVPLITLHTGIPAQSVLKLATKEATAEAETTKSEKEPELTE